MAERLVDRARRQLDRRLEQQPRAVINATGVILHTNLGRAPLSRAALDAMERVGGGYSALEFDLEAGTRGSRHEHVSALLRDLTGADDALVVNNNASAVLLALAALATGRDVVISRGELVEIGGGFRIPDVLRESGARLVEVGTTNRTYVEDYDRAIAEDAALVLRVHASNFQVVGFVHSPTLEELVALAHQRGLILVDDLGSGTLIATEQFGLAHEPTVQESTSAGADLVCFSGDKLLGGPQAGLLVGRKEVIDRLRRHPLVRALRPDKATLAALSATLAHYARGEALREIPVWRMISADAATIHRRAEALAAGSDGVCSVVETRAAVGGGSLPGSTLPSFALAVDRADGSAAEIAHRLRSWRVPIVSRVADNRALLDLRTVAPGQDPEIQAAVRAIAVT